jgi:hypothetical protein
MQKNGILDPEEHLSIVDQGDFPHELQKMHLYILNQLTFVFNLQIICLFFLICTYLR